MRNALVCSGGLVLFVLFLVFSSTSLFAQENEEVGDSGEGIGADTQDAEVSGGDEDRDLGEEASAAYAPPDPALLEKAHHHILYGPPLDDNNAEQELANAPYLPAKYSTGPSVPI